jgi:hypothetical protein
VQSRLDLAVDQIADEAVLGLGRSVAEGGHEHPASALLRDSRQQQLIAWPVDSARADCAGEQTAAPIGFESRLLAKDLGLCVEILGVFCVW